MHVVVWKLKRTIVATLLLVSTLFLFNVNLVEAAPGGDVTISDVSPANQSIAIEIIGNPPEHSGYVNLSFTLTDNDGGNDAEFFLNTSTDGITYTNRIHQLSIDSGGYYQHEDSFCTTNNTYFWSIAYRDGTEPFKTEYFYFRSEAVPDPPSDPTPINGTMFNAGENIALKCVVTHPDASATSPPVMNVTFHEYPSGRIIGYDNSSLSSGQTATCDTTYHLENNATKYYWYANASDDEFTGNASDIWYVNTYYNDSEPQDTWYTLGGDIWVEEIYIEPEPTTLWYTLGGEAQIYSIATFNNPSPADDATGQWINEVLSIQVNTSNPKYKNFKTYPSGEGFYGVSHNVTGAATNWEAVDDVVADDGSTYIYSDNLTSYDIDWYELDNHTVGEHGDQLNVTIYYRIINNTRPECNGSEPGTAIAKIRTHDTNYTLSSTEAPDSWTTYSYMWDKNPNTGLEWTWEEIDDLEAGIDMIGCECTQLYINVHYRNSIPLLTTQFYTNDTVDGRWEQIAGNIPEQRTNYTATIGFSNLEFNKDYWWRVRVYNDSVQQYQNSSDYHFTTMSPPSEPDAAWYTLGGDIWVEEGYTDTEPSTVWYTLGGNISIYYNLTFTNETPPDKSVGQWKNGILAVNISQSGGGNYYNITFYTNATVDGRWEAIGTVYNAKAPRTVSFGYGNFQWNTTYWWKVIAVNETLGQNEESSIWRFRTNYSLDEPSSVWYTLGGDIWVEEIYTESEPSTVWYTLGGQALLGAPYDPTDPSPANGTALGKHIFPTFSCYVADPQGYRMNVSFYWGSNDTLIGTDTFVDSGTRASVSVDWLANYTWHSWYAVANNSPDTEIGVEAQSDMWWYLPGNNKPNTTISPDNGDIYVPVRRQLVGGTYQNFVRLLWTLYDNESDIMEFNCFIDDPSIGNWNDWISRYHIYDADNGTYFQDEMLFNQPVTTYHWKLFVSDGYNDTTYFANFTTQFYFWSNFTWLPEHATNNDTVLFIDESQNATGYWWYINGVLVANASGLNASEKFNMTYTFNVSNVYNVTQMIYNESARVYDSMTRYIYIDRNLSLDRSSLSVVVFYGQSPRDEMKVSELCTLLGVTSNAWVHMYNSTSSRWASYWVDYPSLTTDFDIELWDALAFALSNDANHRINITDTPDQREAYFSRTAALENMSDANQTLNLPAGLNYVCWSNVNTTSSPETTLIGLDTNDRVYLYNTSTDTWSLYRIGVGGTTFDIHAYDILVFDLAAPRTVTISSGF